MKIYIIGFVPRSGTNYLCDMLKSVGLGNPTEYYHPLSFQERISKKWLANKHFDPSDCQNPKQYFHRVLESQPGEIKGIKANIESYNIMMQEVGHIINNMEVHHFFVKRADILRQAISWYRAMNTQQWSVFDPLLGSEPPYDRSKIDEIIGWIEGQEREWREALPADTYEIIYEKISNVTVYNIAANMGMKNCMPPKSGYKVQRDKVTEEWAKKYQNNE